MGRNVISGWFSECIISSDGMIGNTIPPKRADRTKEVSNEFEISLLLFNSLE